jgi:hypothetical protein
MHIPSSRVHSEMRSENASVWFVPANGGDEIAILVKAPSATIKSLLAGCDLNILFGKKAEYLATGVRVFDVPDAALLISGIQKTGEEHDSLLKFLSEKKAPLFLFNEMDICLAWTTLSISPDDALKAEDLIGTRDVLYEGAFSDDCNHALDCFCYSVDRTNYQEVAVEIPLAVISTSLDQWRASRNVFVGYRELHDIVIDDQNEGEMFERAIWASLKSVFPLTLYKSPQVEIGKKSRELTDILAFHEYGNFLIEAKDLSVLRANLERSQERRIKGVQKQVKKAINQLVGASKAIARGERVVSAQGDDLSLVRDKPPHCIVLITELTHPGDWSEIEQMLIDAIQSTQAFFHLLDLREFISLLKGSSGKPELLDYNLIKRFELFADKRTVHIRSQPAPNQ